MKSMLAFGLFVTATSFSPSASHASKLICGAVETCFQNGKCVNAVGELSINNRGSKILFGGATWRVTHKQTFSDGKKVYLASSAKKYVRFQHSGIEGVFSFTDRNGDPASGMTVFFNCKGKL